MAVAGTLKRSWTMRTLPLAAVLLLGVAMSGCTRPAASTWAQHAPVIHPVDRDAPLLGLTIMSDPAKQRR
jgi:hypothetical protein